MKTAAIFFLAVFCTLLLCSEAQQLKTQKMIKAHKNVELWAVKAEQKKVKELVQSQEEAVEETPVRESDPEALLKHTKAVLHIQAIQQNKFINELSREALQKEKGVCGKDGVCELTAQKTPQAEILAHTCAFSIRKGRKIRMAPTFDVCKRDFHDCTKELGISKEESRKILKATVKEEKSRKTVIKSGLIVSEIDFTARVEADILKQDALSGSKNKFTRGAAEKALECCLSGWKECKRKVPAAPSLLQVSSKHTSEYTKEDVDTFKETVKIPDGEKCAGFTAKQIFQHVKEDGSGDFDIPNIKDAPELGECLLHVGTTGDSVTFEAEDLASVTFSKCKRDKLCYEMVDKRKRRRRLLGMYNKGSC